MGRACCTHGKNLNAYRVLVGKSEKKRDHQETLDVCGRTILKWVLDKMGLYR
jgi:hypothetical protein